MIHYYLNYSGDPQKIAYPYGGGTELLSGEATGQSHEIVLKPWDLAIVEEK